MSLTPQGLNYGGSTTVGIGNIIVPPLGAYQTVNLVQNITLPAVEPSSIANYTNFGLTMTQDADYLTNDLYPHQPDQGAGLDQAAISITTSSTSTATVGNLPDLAASSVLLSKSSVNWGSTRSGHNRSSKPGPGRLARRRLVFFVLTGQTGSLTDAIFLGETTIPALAPGATQQINQTLALPVRLPAGVSLGSVGYARIEVLTNPENDFDESIYYQRRLTVAAVHRAAPRQRDHRADHAGRRDAPLDSGAGDPIPEQGQGRRRRKARGQSRGAKRHETRPRNCIVKSARAA